MENVMRRKTPRKRIATTNISAARFRDPKDNPNRIRFAQKLLESARQNNIDCLCLPSGYLAAKTPNDIKPAFSPLLRKAKQLQISFVIGSDIKSAFRSRVPHAIVRQQQLPAFLVAFNCDNDITTITRQRSGSSLDYRLKLVPDSVMFRPRVMRLGDCEFQIVGCGEVYDRRLFSKGMPRAAIVFGHDTMPRLSISLQSRSSSGFSLVNTEHRIHQGGYLFCYDNGENRSVRDCDHFDGYDDLWADIAVWELDKQGSFRHTTFTKH